MHLRYTPVPFCILRGRKSVQKSNRIFSTGFTRQGKQSYSMKSKCKLKTFNSKSFQNCFTNMYQKEKTNEYFLKHWCSGLCYKISTAWLPGVERKNILKNVPAYNIWNEERYMIWNFMRKLGFKTFFCFCVYLYESEPT